MQLHSCDWVILLNSISYIYIKLTSKQLWSLRCVYPGHFLKCCIAIFKSKPPSQSQQKQRNNDFKRHRIQMYKESHFFIAFISTSAYGFPSVKKVIDVSGTLMVKTEDWPQSFHFTLAFMGVCFSCR